MYSGEVVSLLNQPFAELIIDQPLYSGTSTSWVRPEVSLIKSAPFYFCDIWKGLGSWAGCKQTSPLCAVFL